MSSIRVLQKGENAFLRSFPPPQFLTMPAVGLDVSDASIKCIALTDSSLGKIPVMFGEEKLPADTVVRGEIRDMEKLVEMLATVSKNIQRRFIRASLPEQKAYFFTTDVPSNASREQVLKVLEFKLEEHVPLSPAEAIVDYDPLPFSQNADSSELLVGVTVYPKNTVEKYTTAFLRAGLFPLSLEIEAQAIARSVVPEGDKGTYILVDFGETSTGLSIASEGNLRFTSTLDVAGSTITNVISEELNIEKEEIVHIKNTIGLSGNAHYATLTKKLIQTVRNLGEEIKRHHSYWGTREKMEHAKRKTIDGVILCGGNANIKGLPEYLEQVLKTSVRRANVWENAFSFDEYIPEMPYGTSLSYATAIGLALRDEH